MAYVNTSRAVGLADRIAAIAGSFRKAIAQRAIYRQTMRELNALSAKELADLGIHHSAIRSLAHEAAYGK